ncbi:PD40 domain-containing protein [Planctomyces sp. SH-PL62]|uniref:PD40 domain-containing protein n=1 Tax=Planctomyces sp. SH-PL62 TaxID=1636152 RepID=UPI00078B962D|nr:PD40 domain-containing protein [Planctomyces sp. SH-PL62]AMV39475.1 translocation protein TolB [Planctomyces sp. SH-PL62]
MLSSLVGLPHVLSAALATVAFGAPIDWSRDGRWIAHLAVDSAEAPALPHGWILAPAIPSPTPAAARRVYRLWATRAGSSDSVLLAESSDPLSSPTWGPDGRSLVFGRFVATQPDGPSSVRGRYEVVVQSGLDQKRVIVVQPDLELDAESRAAIVLLRPTLSADGRRLAIPRPGPAGGVWLLRLDEDRVSRTIDAARFPAWSPDGLRLVYLKLAPGPDGPGVSVHLLNPAGGGDRLLSNDAALTASPPVWGLDSQTILMIASPTRGPFRHTQVDLVRINVEAGFSARISTLEAAAPVNVPQRFRGPATAVGERLPTIHVELALDGEQEQGVCLVDADGQDQVMKWYTVQTQNTFKRFHPLDAGLRIRAPALSPDGRTLAFRVLDGGPSGLAAFCDLNTEEIVLIAPDAATRDRWLDRLAACAVDLIQTWLPMTAGDGPGNRATILPILSELGGIHPRQYRLQRLAKFARSLLEELPPADRADPSPESFEEFRLFFAYLNRDYATAERHLDAVEAASDDPGSRLRWLCLRTQILLGQGEVDRARGIIDYIDRETNVRAVKLEHSPAGPVLTEVENPENAWAKHLAQKATDGALRRAQAGMDGLDFEEAREPDPGLGPGELDRMPNLPFAPNAGVDQGLNPIAPDEFGGIAPPRPRPRIFVEPGDGVEGPAGRPFRAPAPPPPGDVPILHLEQEN